MEVERESVKLRLNKTLTRIAHFQSIKAHFDNIPSSSSSRDVSVFAFPGSWEVKAWYEDDNFGETEVDRDLFPSLRRIGENRFAKVNAAFLRRFQHLLNNSAFTTEVEKAVVEDKKKILFTGHSSGGAIASLATLWMLDEYFRKRGKRFAIGCVTFGSPLIGDRTFSHAVRREKWAGHFTHFVMEHDIVPRMMLAPKISIQQHLPNILKFFQQKLIPTKHESHKVGNPETAIDQDPSIEADEAVEFFENVTINASTVASHVAFNLMEPTNSLMEKLSVDYVKVSPYRPSGFYVFCTGKEAQGQQLVVENPDAVLQLLFYFLQLPDENQNLAEFAVNSLSESLSYGDELNNVFGLANLKGLYDHLLASNGTAGDAVGINNKALSELSAGARLCLMAADEGEKRKNENEKRIDLQAMEDNFNEIQKYKEEHANYYEAFKLQDEPQNFKANMNRLELAKIWDEVVEMVMREDLPDEFEGREEWAEVGMVLRRLVEPLDVANFYRHSTEGCVLYTMVRPKRYRFTQRWYHHTIGNGKEETIEEDMSAEPNSDFWYLLRVEDWYVCWLL